MYSALVVARYIIKRCNELNRPISNLKLQKLLYFVQAEFLVGEGSACFPEEIEAWDFGPVVPEVYHRYKAYGSASIPYLAGAERVRRICTEDKEIINGIVDEGSLYTANQLVEITHNQAPWREAYMPYRSNIISKEAILNYFKEK